MVLSLIWRYSKRIIRFDWFVNLFLVLFAYQDYTFVAGETYEESFLMRKGVAPMEE